MFSKKSIANFKKGMNKGKNDKQNKQKAKPVEFSRKTTKPTKSQCEIFCPPEIIKYFSVAFLAYLISRNILDLTIKHTVYISLIGYFHVEFFLASIYGLLNSCLLAALLVSYFKSWSKQLINICDYYLYGYFLTYLVISMIQMYNQMSFWEHKYFLNDFAVLELAKFVIESLLFFAFLLIRTF